MALQAHDLIPFSKVVESTALPTLFDSVVLPSCFVRSPFRNLIVQQNKPSLPLLVGGLPREGRGEGVFRPY